MLGICEAPPGIGVIWHYLNSVLQVPQCFLIKALRDTGLTKYNQSADVIRLLLQGTLQIWDSFPAIPVVDQQYSEVVKSIEVFRVDLQEALISPDCISRLFFPEESPGLFFQFIYQGVFLSWLARVTLGAGSNIILVLILTK